MARSCEEIAGMLVDYADEQLSAADSNEVVDHLAGCADCRRKLDALQRSLELAGVIWEDGLAETEAIRVPVSQKARRVRWSRYAAIAASILLVVTASVVWRALVRPRQAGPSFAEIEREIIDEGTAAKLLAAADLLADKSYAKELIKSQYEYILDSYPNTKAAATARLRTQ